MMQLILKILALVIFTFVLVGSALGTEATDLDSILARHAEALGGRERLVSIKSISAQASIRINNIDGRQVSYHQFPLKFYVRYEMGPMSQTLGFDGLVGWQVDGNGIGRTQSAEERKSLVNEIYFQTYSYLLKTGMDGRIEYHGISQIEGEPFHQLQLFPDGGDSLFILISTKTDLVEYRMDAAGGINLVTKYSDFRDVDGLMVPFLSQTTATNAPMEVVARIESIEINPEIADSIFNMPGKSGDDFAWPDQADSIVIPFKYRDNHIYLPIRVNGQGEFEFLLDSGAGGIMISRRAAEQLGLDRLGDLPARGLGGYGTYGLTQIDSMNIASLSLYIKNIIIGDLDVGEGRSKWSLDGILGYDFFTRFPMMIDFDRNEITIFRSSLSGKRREGTKLEMEVYYQLPIVEARLDGYPLRVAIDLGSQTGIILQKSARAFEALAQKIDSASMMYSIGGVGGITQVRGGRLDSLWLGGLLIDSPMVLLSGDFESAPLPEYIEGLIGMEILKRFNLFIDYPAREIYLLRRD